MTQTKRMKALFISLVVFAVLLAAALFSVSFAMWDAGDGSGSEVVNGNSGLFYVEYPQYVTESGIAIPVLEKDTYYLQVQKANGVSDYYAMKDNPEKPTTEKMLTNVYLTKDTVLDLYKGTSKNQIENKESGSTEYFSHPNGGPATAKVTATGYYDFYYKFTNYSTMYVAYKSAGSSSGGGNSSTAAPERDTTKKSVKIKFSDTTIVFNMATDLGGGETYFHIWKADTAGQRTEWPGLKMSTGADVACTPATASQGNTVEFSFKSTEVAGILLNNNNGKQVGDSTVFYDALFSGLQANYTYTITTTQTHWDNFTYGKDFGEADITSKFSVSGKAPSSSGSGSGGGTTTTITPAKPATTGATSFTVGSQQKNEEVVTVRTMDATMNEVSTGKYEYHNYICVSRKNADESADDNSIVVLEFEIEGKGATPNLKNIPVSAITLTRRDTDEEGNPVNGYITPAPRVYNYDLTNPVYLSEIGHGAVHSTFEDVKGKNTENMIAHYDDGMYVILYFADKKQQYFALDLSIETTEYAEFILTASVNNTNKWDRYREGFGEEWGYYMGGLINEVWMWNPTRTTKFEVDSGTVVFDRTKENEFFADNTKTIDDFNNSAAFKYKIKDYSVGGTIIDEDGNPMYARYTKEYVDISLTINLTAGSKIKLSMLDESGERGDIGNDLMRPTTYYLPNKIIASPNNLFAGADNYDNDLNFVVPQTGEYSFRFTGYIHDKVGKWMKKADGSISETKPSTADASKYVQIPEYNFVIDRLYISHSDVVGKMNTVTFDANGGEFSSDAVTTQNVRFGNIVSFAEGKAPQKDQITPPAEKEFAGWYYKGKDDDGNPANIDYDGDPVLENMVLYAKWVGKEYTVTFDLNAPAGTTPTLSGSETLKTNNSGTLEGKTLPTATLTGYACDGWYTKNEDGTLAATAIDATTTFTADTTVYAKWTQLFTVTFYNNYPETADSAFKTQTGVRDGATISPPTGTPTVVHYTFDNKWYKEAACENEWNFATDTVEDNISLYAGWTKAKYNVTFDLNGLPTTVFTAPATQPVEYKDTATDPNLTAPEGSGYTITGWYTAETGDDKFDFNTEITGNKTLYAHWTALDGLYANGLFVKELVADGDSTTKLKVENVSLKSGEKLTFWKDNAQITTNVYVRGGLSNGEMTGTSYSNITVNTSGYFNIYYDPTNDTTKGGLWVTYGGAYVEPALTDGDGLYDADNLDGDPIAALVVNSDGANEVKATSVLIGVKTTIKFKYGGNVVKVKQKDSCPTGVFNTTDGTVTLDAGTYNFYLRYTDYALWIDGTAAEYTVEYTLPTGATNAATNPTTYKNADGTKTIGDPTMPSDKVFLGWKLTDANGSDVEQITPENIDTLSKGTTTITLYADWDYMYTVTFSYNYTGAPNNGVYATINVQNKNTIADDKMPSEPSRPGHKFKGWYKEAACNNAWDASDTVNGPTVLYADWEESVVALYTITFNVNTANGGSGTNTVYSNKQQGETITVPNDPSPSNDLYDFDGWYNAATGGSKVTPATTVGTSDVTYYAQYKAARYRIVLDVSGWEGGTGYDYHIHAWNAVGTITGGTATDKWSNRDLMTYMGDNKYYVDFTNTSIANIIFTQDTKGTRTEQTRYSIAVSGIQLGDTYTVSEQLVKFEIALDWINSWSGVNSFKIAYSTTTSNPSSNVDNAFSFNSHNSIMLPATTKKLYFFFDQSGAAWRSPVYSASFVYGNSYIISSVSWGGDGPPKVANITVDPIYKINVTFKTGSGILRVRYVGVTEANRGIYYYNHGASAVGPTAIKNLTSITDSSDDTLTFILTKQIGWNGDGNQSDNVTCTLDSATSKTYAIKDKNGGSVMAYVETVGIKLSGNNLS